MRKELSKLPYEVSSSAVSSSVRLSFRENFASRTEISNFKHLRYLPHGLAKNSRKLDRTRNETAELITSRGSLVSSLLKCATGFTVSRSTSLFYRHIAKFKMSPSKTTPQVLNVVHNLAFNHTTQHISQRVKSTFSSLILTPALGNTFLHIKNITCNV